MYVCLTGLRCAHHHAPHKSSFCCLLHNNIVRVLRLWRTPAKSILIDMVRLRSWFLGLHVSVVSACSLCTPCMHALLWLAIAC